MDSNISGFDWTKCIFATNIEEHVKQVAWPPGAANTVCHHLRARPKLHRPV